MWAIAQMKKGKKVRRKSHFEESYLYSNNSCLEVFNQVDLLVKFDIHHIDATDWKIFKEDKK